MLNAPSRPPPGGEPEPRATAAANRAVLRPGHNCWRTAHADRLAFLIDGERYFRELRRAIANARHSVLILSWDIDSRLELVPGGADDGLPEPLGELLDAVVRRRRSLRVHVLSWDYAMLFALEREWLQDVRLDLNTHRRLAFRLDDAHPIGASHHQKLVVIDDRLAFIGGIDLTRCRWDTSDHAADNALRRDPDGKPYPPFHDVQAMLAGDAARVLGEHARERWRRATGKRIARAPASTHRLWPDDVAAEITDIEVGIARTEPAYDGYEGTHEIRNLLVDAIAGARTRIFFEQQYFTASAVGGAIEARLRAPAPPEVVVLMAKAQCGWLEDHTMGVMRARLDRVLREADPAGRYRMYASCGGKDRGRWLNIHSKIAIVDDDFLTIGSANASNRSLGFDTELNLAIEANGEARVQRLIASLRERLVAEHTGATAEAVREITERTGSVIAAIEAGRCDERALVRFEPRGVATLEAIVPEALVIDPEAPMLPERLVGELVDHAVKPSVRRRLLAPALATLVLAALVAAWRHIASGDGALAAALRDALSLPRFVAFAESLRAEPLAPFAMVAAYVLAGFVAFPLVLLVAATGLVFGPWLGIPIALAGALAGAAAGFAAGRAAGRERVRRHAGVRMNRLSRRLGERGLVSLLLVRVIPVAPFAVINVVAGASRLTWRDFLIGTAAGLGPGIVLALLFVDRAVVALRDPGAATVGLVVALAAFVIGISAFLANRAARPGPRRARRSG